MLTNVITMMKEVENTEDQINVIINDNPKFFLDNEKP